jgi:hypothetical protein
MEHDTRPRRAQRSTDGNDSGDATPTPTPTPGREVQMRGAGTGASSEHVHAAATEGTSGAGGPLPHLDIIQRLFGPFDVSNVRAHTDDRAERSARSMGAEAFAFGDQVAFGGTTPSLHTAAHEAAHVVQQRAGVHLKGGVGQAGDRYEQHADAVADLVVAGKSAAPLLAEVAGGPASASSGDVAVQHQLTGEDPQRYFRRKMITAHSINELHATGVMDPSAVRVCIFSGREGLVANISPIRTNQRARDEVPHTPMSHIREDHHGGARSTDAVSRDGEMFQIDEIREVIGQFVQARPGFAMGHTDELRIELIGPRGTCTDCQAGLQVAVNAWQGVMNETFGPGAITLSMVARWTAAQVEHGQRTNNRRDQSTTYGTTDAHGSPGPKLGTAGRIDAPHWKNPMT